MAKATPDQRALSEDVRSEGAAAAVDAGDWPLRGPQVATNPAGISPWALPIYPRRYGVEQLGPAGAHLTPDLAAHPLPADALEERPGPGRHGVFERPPRPLRYQPRCGTQLPPSHALVRAPGRRLRLAAERDSGTRCTGAAPRSDQVSLGREAKESARSVQRPAAGPRVPAVGRAESGEDVGGVQQHLLGHAHRAHRCAARRRRNLAR